MSTYSINVECTNCDHSGTAQLEKGTPVPDVIECPNCGCATAKKRTNQPVQLPPSQGWPWIQPKPIYGPTWIQPNTLTVSGSARSHLDGVMIN